MGPRTRFITSEITQVGGPGLSDANDAAVYLVQVANQAALIPARPLPITATSQGASRAGVMVPSRDPG